MLHNKLLPSKKTGRKSSC